MRYQHSGYHDSKYHTLHIQYHNYVYLNMWYHWDFIISNCLIQDNHNLRFHVLRDHHMRHHSYDITHFRYHYLRYQLTLLRIVMTMRVMTLAVAVVTNLAFWWTDVLSLAYNTATMIISYMITAMAAAMTRQIYNNKLYCIGDSAFGTAAPRL